MPTSATDLLNTFRDVTSTANDVGVRPELVHALVRQESGWNPEARSPAGALGLLQVMPATARQPGFGVQPFNATDPRENLKGGVQYLKALLVHYNGDEAKALAAYNAGPGRVDRGGPLPAETQKYVPAVQAGAGAAQSAPSASDQMTQFRAQQSDEGPVQRFAEGAWDNLNPMGLVRAIAHPIDTAKNLVGAQVDQFRKAKADYDQGRYVEMAGHGAAGLIPILGPAAAHAGETMASGDVARGLGEVAGIGGSLLLPDAIGGAASKLRAIPESVMESAQKVTQKMRDRNPSINFGRVYLDEGISATNKGQAKLKSLIDADEAEKAAMRQNYPGGRTDFPQRGDAVLQDLQNKLKQGAAPREALSQVGDVREQLNEHPNFSRPTYGQQTTYVSGQQQVPHPLGVTGNNGQPVMVTQNVTTPVTRTVQTGRQLTPASADATWDVMREENNNTRPNYGRTDARQWPEQDARKRLRGAASDSLGALYDPQVEASRNARTPFEQIKDYVSGNTERTYSEIQGRESGRIAAYKAMTKREAGRNNANPLSLTSQIGGAVIGASTHGLGGAGLGIIVGQLLAKPAGLSMLARALNVPIETAARIARVAQAGQFGAINVAGNASNRP